MNIRRIKSLLKEAEDIVYPVGSFAAVASEAETNGFKLVIPATANQPILEFQKGPERLLVAANGDGLFPENNMWSMPESNVAGVDANSLHIHLNGKLNESWMEDEDLEKCPDSKSFTFKKNKKHQLLLGQTKDCIHCYDGFPMQYIAHNDVAAHIEKAKAALSLGII